MPRGAADDADAVGVGGVDYAGEARSLAEWLVENRSRGYSGFCGGHRHEIQHLHTKSSPNDPDIVSTSHAGKALLAAGQFDDRYAAVARTAADFVFEDLNYREVVGAGRYDATLRDALAFCRNVLFEPDGAPDWDESSAYPRDVHAAAQGILVFTYAGDDEFARQILEWAVVHLYTGDGRFYYREQQLYTKRITLMRWCQTRIASAISEYLASK